MLTIGGLYKTTRVIFSGPVRFETGAKIMFLEQVLIEKYAHLYQLKFLYKNMIYITHVYKSNFNAFEEIIF